MSLPRSTPEVEQQHLDAFGPRLGPIYHGLYNEVLQLHWKWAQFQMLFGGSPERIQLLNASAPGFFWLIQQVLWEDILLHVAVLTDPPQQHSNKNLSLPCLPELVDDPRLAAYVREILGLADLAAKRIRKQRDKLLAHRDRAVVLNGKAKRLPEVRGRDVAYVLGLFADLMDRLHSEYVGGNVAFSAIRGSGDADALVCALAIAADLEERRQQRAREGKLLPEDFEQPTVP